MLDLKTSGPLHLQEERNLPEGFLLLVLLPWKQSSPGIREYPAPFQRQQENTFPPGHQLILPRSILAYTASRRADLCPGACLPEPHRGAPRLNPAWTRSGGPSAPMYSARCRTVSLGVPICTF